jgi:hypothetical protein
MVFECVFRSGAHPDVFKLCRRDKSSVSRHITRHHGGKSNNVDVQPYYSAGETIKNARKYIENIEKKDSHSDQDKRAEKKLNNTGTADMPAASQPSPVARTQSTLISKTGISSPPASQHLIQSTLNISAKSVDNMSTTTLLKGQGFSRATSDVSLHAKVDMLIQEFKAFKLNSTANSAKGGGTSTILSAIDSKSAGEMAELLLHWPEVKNIIDLVQLCKHIRFFSGDQEQRVLSVLRCDTCFNYIRSKRPTKSHTSSPADVAKKGLGG